jgi:microcompartment protein CcmK/EutM
MTLARVVGTVWGARQSPGLSGRRVVEVRPLAAGRGVPGTRIRQDEGDDLLEASTMLAVDPLGADVGQLVLVAVGSRVRDLVLGPWVETKHAVIAIVDEAQVEGPGRPL